jgi:acetyl-CoA synthetase
VCFVVLRPGAAAGEPLRQALSRCVVDGLGKALKPDAVKFVGELPKTRNAKVMRRLIRAVYLTSHPGALPAGATAPALGDVSALDNPRALDAVRSAS